jgi:hypothetical protein
MEADAGQIIYLSFFKTWMYLITIPALAIPGPNVFVITFAPAGVDGRKVKRGRDQTAGNY